MITTSKIFRGLEFFEVAIRAIVHPFVRGFKLVATFTAFFCNNSESHSLTSLCDEETSLHEAIHVDNFFAVVRGEVEGRIVNLKSGYPGGRAKSGSFRFV